MKKVIFLSAVLLVGACTDNWNFNEDNYYEIQGKKQQFSEGWIINSEYYGLFIIGLIGADGTIHLDIDIDRIYENETMSAKYGTISGKGDFLLIGGRFPNADERVDYGGDPENPVDGIYKFCKDESVSDRYFLSVELYRNIDFKSQDPYYEPEYFEAVGGQFTLTTISENNYELDFELELENGEILSGRYVGELPSVLVEGVGIA